MSDSILDRPVILSEVFDPALFTELCQSYVGLYQVGIRVFDREQNKLVDVAPAGGQQSWLARAPDARRALAAFTAGLKQLSLTPEERVLREEEATGAWYLAAPITYEGDVLGKLILGPFALIDAPAEGPQAGGPADQLARMGRDHLFKIADTLLTAININCHAGYRAVLTSHMHLESITGAYAELQKKHQQLIETNERLRELDRMKSNFLATVSHELRTPLTSVIGYSEMLLEGLVGPLTEEQREYVTIIMEKGESLLHLISGILDISKIENGASDIVLQRARPELLVEGALSTIRPQAAKKRLALEVQYAQSLPELKVDAYKIRQVLINLLGNAVKFTPAAGAIRVRVEPEGDQEAGEPTAVRFDVADTGIGIPQDKLTRVFETFFQVDNSSTREYGGTGLGLAIVKNFVESHGGQVQVDSEPGQGTTFTFRLPVHQAAPADAAPTTERNRSESPAI